MIRKEYLSMLEKIRAGRFISIKGTLKDRIQTAYASETALGKDWDSKEEDEAWKDL